VARATETTEEETKVADIQVPSPDEVAEQKQKVFTKRVALITGVYAVVLAIASLGGGNAMKDMLSSTTEAANQWSFFQAKNMRENLYRIEAERIQVDLISRGATLAAEARAELTKLRAAHIAKADRYQKDRVKITGAAKKHEKERDSAAKKDPYFDYAGVLLQISLILASISMLSESHAVFWFSLVGAVGGSALTVGGFLAG
jgi:Domain of unknown function (DUF4337)